MVKRVQQLTLAMVLAGSLVGAAPTPVAYAEEGGQSGLHREIGRGTENAKPIAPPPRPPGLGRDTSPDRPPQAETPFTGPKPG